MKSNQIILLVITLMLGGAALTVAVDPSVVYTRLAIGNPATMIPSASIEEPMPEPAVKEKPEIEVVFVLDTTGSMGGLIEGAKQKIWSIINELKQGQPEPDLKIGLVAYRDRSDDYVTRHSPLTEDIDLVYSDLMAFRAAGGGDTPESVNQALHEALTHMQWSTDTDTLRVVFLVGDAPPKMNYQDDVKYTVSCGLAMKKDIIINTIQCGNAQETRDVWKSIAQMSSGGYAMIRQDGGMVVAATPMDAEIDKLNQAINATVIPYGTQEQQAIARRKLGSAMNIAGFASAERSEYLSYAEPAAAITGREDLTAEIMSKRIVLDEIEMDHLPSELQGEEKAEVIAQVQSNIEKRLRYQEELKDALARRKAYLDDRAGSTSGTEPADAFDTKVKEMIRAQAAAKSIVYEDKGD